MSRQNKASLTKQVQNALTGKVAFGTSKHADKSRNATGDKIYAGKTLETYMRQCNQFASWCKENHGCKTLEQCHSHVNDYLQHRIDSGYSAWTIKTDSSAIAKMYGESTKDYMQTPSRHRGEAMRSREQTPNDRGFSVANNQSAITFAQTTGMRRSEMEKCKGSDYHERDGKSYISVYGSKGGKDREIQLCGTKEEIQQVREMCQNAGDNKVFADGVHTKMDVHSYRADYCSRIYNEYARDTETLDRSELYIARGDMAGHVWDRQAMLIASQNLGHNRIDVIASSYLYK